MKPKQFLTGTFLLAAPVAAAAWLIRQHPTVTIDGGLLSLVVLAMFSPLFFAVPALVTQHQRDRALAGVANPARALRLVPHLMFSRHSEVRFETTMSVAGFLLAAALLHRYALAGIHAIS